MNFSNYVDEHNNVLLVENDSILYIEVKNNQNTVLNDLCLDINFLEKTNQMASIHKFDFFEISEIPNEDATLKSYILKIEEYEILIFKNDYVSIVDELAFKIEKYKGEVGNLSNEAANLKTQAQSFKKSQTKSITKTKSKNKTNPRRPSR